MNKEKLFTFCKENKYKLVRLTYTMIPGEVTTDIVVIGDLYDESRLAFFTHLYSLTENYMYAGGMGINSEHVLKIEQCTVEDLEMWKKEYESFHQSCIEEDGYDASAIDSSLVHLGHIP